MSAYVELADLGRHRPGPRRRPPRPPVVISPTIYPYPYYPYSYSDFYPSPLVEEVRVVDEDLDPFAEEKKAEEEKRRKAEEERRLEALKAKLKAEIKKELGLADAGMGQWRRWRPPYNPYLAQNYAAAAQRALYDALAWQYGLLPYVPPRAVTVRKVISPQAAELDLLYSGAHEADADPDFMGTEDTPGAKDAGFMDDVASSAVAASVGGAMPLAAVLAGAAVGFWLAKKGR